MDKKIFTTRVKTNLNGVLQTTQTIDGIMMTGDNAANQIIVEVYDGVEKVDLVKTEDNKIVGYFIRSDGYTVEVDGTIEDGNAKVIIPEVAYLISGQLSIAIRYLDGPTEHHDDEGIPYIVWDSKIVIAALSCYIQMTESNSIIDPTHHIPDVQELLEYLDRLKREQIVIEEAEGLRVIAEEGREQAESTRQSTFTQNESNRQTTFEQAESTRQSTFTQNESNRQTTFEQAESIRQSQELTRQSQETARENAQSRRNALIDGMTVDAIKLDPYSDPTATITEVSGHKHILFGLAPGDPFVIAKTFDSIIAMQNYPGTDLRIGQFVIISTGNVEDPDNAKMYVVTSAKTASGGSNAFSFVTDLSGAQGIQGPRGYTGNGISGIYFSSDYKITISYTNGNSWTSPVPIRGEKGEKGDKGDQGDPGPGSATISYDSTTSEVTVAFY